MNNISIQFEDLTVFFSEEEPIVENINITIEKASVTLITGKNSSGKTTMLNVISGLIPNMHDGTVKGKKTIHGSVGMCIQYSDVFLMPTVYEELKFVLANSGFENEKIDEMIEEYADLLQVKPLIQRNMHELSGGERQKIAILCACIDQREIVVFDEPLMQTDVEFTDIFFTLIKKLQDENRTVIIASLDPIRFQALSPRVLVLEDKKIIDFPTIEGFQHFDRPLQAEDFTLDKGERLGSSQGQVLKIKDLCFSHQDDKPLIKDLNFSMNSGELVAIAGNNGAGKTTLLNLIMGIIKPQSGEIYLDGECITEKTIQERSNDIGYLFQDPSHQMFQNQIIKEISWGLERLQLSKEEINSRVEKWLEILELQSFREDHPYSLSQSVRKKVALAGVMVRNPKLVLLDEPTHGFDSSEKKKFIDIIINIRNEGHAVIAVTHDPIIKEISDQILTLGGEDEDV